MQTTIVFPVHKREGNLLMLLALFIIIFSCSKNSGPQPPDNEINATVLFASGNTAVIKARGWDADMGCGPFVGGSYISGNNEGRKDFVSIEASNYIVNSPLNQCVTSPGTFTIIGQYRTHIDTGRMYTTFGVANPGTITFSTMNNEMIMGTFAAVCKFQNDSVIITGTFRGKPQ